MAFESSVNSEGIETGVWIYVLQKGFESSVNSEGIETKLPGDQHRKQFESSVNSEGIETSETELTNYTGLRAV